MKVLEIISQFRLLVNDYSTQNLEIVAWLRQGDVSVFNTEGGASNPEIRNALQTVFTDTITPSRNIIVLPRDFMETPLVTVGGMKCHMISMADGQLISGNPIYLPAASIERRSVTVYDKPAAFDPTAVAQKGKEVRIVFLRQPDKIQYVGGLNIRVSTKSGYGTGSTKSFKLAEVVSSKTAASFSKNQLVGGYVSVQVDANTRADYQIEEHDSGALYKIYVGSTPEYIKVLDRTFQAPRSGDRDYTGSVHKSSDLPERLHPQIAVISAEMFKARETDK
jgi:hypothetical protein